MPTQPSFDNVVTQTIDWTSFSGTSSRKGVIRLLPVASSSSKAIDRWQRVGSVLQDIVRYAFDRNEKLRVDGSRWSLSNISDPDKLALSLAAHDVCEAAPERWISERYRARLAASELTPVLISGSMTMQRINRQLALRHLALQTSGASNGQTLAGAMATGTHGAAIKLGACHDAIGALHLMIGPDKGVILQPASRPLKAAVAADLTRWLGFEHELISDDELYECALVHLGSLGLVLGLIVEAAPLYYLHQLRTPFGQGDERWLEVMGSADPSIIAGNAPDPDHLEIIINPYRPRPKYLPRAWLKSMVKRPFSGQPGVETTGEVPELIDPDFIGFAAHLSDVIDLRLANPTLRTRISKELVERYGLGPLSLRALPGAMFGASKVLRGRGQAIEYSVDADLAAEAIEVVLDRLDHEHKRGRMLLGAIGVRFVGGSRALLAQNRVRTTCNIELPGIRTKEALQIFRACAKGLDAAGIDFGCHWGLHNLNTPARVQAYWGARATAWTRARKRLLTSRGCSVFESRVLAESGLS